MHVLARTTVLTSGMRAMPKHTEPAAGVDPTPCNCLALRQAARHVSQLYDRHLAEAGLRTTQYSILSKLGRWARCRSANWPRPWSWSAPRSAVPFGPLERDGLVKVGAGPDGRTRSVKLDHDGRGPPQGRRSALAAGAKGIRNSRRRGRRRRPADCIAARDLRDLRAGRYAW